MNSYLQFNREKVLGSLGMCARAGKCVRGDTLYHAIKSRDIYGVLIATDASDRTKAELRALLQHQSLDVYEILTRDELSQAIGKYNTVAVGISDVGFHKLIRKNIMG